MADSKETAPAESAPDNKEEKEETSGNLVTTLLEKLSLGTGEETPVQKLETLDLEGVIKYIKEGKAKSIITLAGAGISTAAGIPDFRSPGTGLYDSLSEYNLPDPMAIFSLDYFKEQPEPFFKVAKTFYPESYYPTTTHCLLSLLNEKGLLLRHYTQNIDMLEEKAGLPAKKIVYAHGNFQTSHCIECSKDYSLEWMRNFVLSDKVPKCEAPDCEGLVKPDIVFFGESLPPRFAQKVNKDFKQADLLIIIGTSLVVMPFAGLVDQVKSDVPRMYINREMKEEGGNWMLALLGIKPGLRCGQEDNYRDVFAQGDCDDVCSKIAEQLGWKKELLDLYQAKNTNAKKSTDPKGATGQSSVKTTSKTTDPKKSSNPKGHL